jgi:hypothetical protein
MWYFKTDYLKVAGSLYVSSDIMKSGGGRNTIGQVFGWK